MVITSMQTYTSLFVRADAAAILVRLKELFDSLEIECFIVGGYVRDGILERTNHDIDLVVPNNALEVARQVADAFAAKLVLLNETHQVARVILGQDEGHWFLDFATMRGSIEDDLGERDFTVDAIAVKLDQFKAGWNKLAIIDPLEGLVDLQEKKIRAICDSVFVDDPVRLLRSFRIAAELDFSIDEQTQDFIQRDSSLITSVSGERIREELGRILETDKAADTLRHMDHLGLLDILFPELSVSKGVEQPKEHHWNVFDHSMETVVAVERLLVALSRKGDLLDSLAFSDDLMKHFNEQIRGGLTRKALLKLEALLHDVAKPQTKAIHENGKMRFLGHAQQGATIADGILERLRFSNRERKIVTGVIDQHLRPGHLSNAPDLPTRRAIYRYFRDTGDVGIDTLFLSLADHLATRGPSLEMSAWLEHVEVTQYMLTKRYEEEKIVSPPKLVDGHVLMEKFGIEPGPEVGRLLEAIREAQASGEITTEEDALDYVRKELGNNYASQR